MKLEEVAKLTILELLVHTDEEIKKLAQAIVDALLKKGS